MLDCMHGHNAAFIAGPLNYVGLRSVNNLLWFRAAIADKGTLAQLNNRLGVRKWGYFDLEAINTTTVKLKVVESTDVADEVPIQGYWCPFIQGHDTLPGWVDIPKCDPTYNFVFTAGMNGCRLVVTNKSETEYRVYHHQHPDERGPARENIWALIERQGHPVVDTLGYDEYGLGDQEGFPNAFNFLHYSGDRWWFVSQPQTFDMHSLVCKLIAGRAKRRSLPPQSTTFSAPVGRSQAQQLQMAMRAAYDDDDD